jgi:predicted enzyme related to lactoylglutathione lyase
MGNELRETYMAGVPCWVDAVHDDPAAAAAFYGGVLGWDMEDAMPPDAGTHYFMARVDGKLVAAVGSRPAGAPAGAGWNTYVAVEDADAAAARAAELGGTVVSGPMEVGEAGRLAGITDPEGALFFVWEAGTTAGAELVNVPGAWNFSGLNARDPGAAAAFYGALFGWEAGPADPEGGARMVYLPGYGDHLAERDPGLRERMAGLGAPERFEDVVAWITPVADGLAPHWDVTFAVADADDAAARAVERGGRIVLPPTDMPWVRTTVISDPEGAMFTASRFVPPGREV